MTDENKEQSSLNIQPSFSTFLTEKGLEVLVSAIEKRVKAYHEMFSLPLIAELWEETLHRSFIDCDLETSWQPTRSHMVGEDMRINGFTNSRISCKSGQFINNRTLGKQCVKFNGSRSTKYETLEEKLKHFSNSHDDFYFMLAKNKNFDKQYKLLIFPSSVCNVSQLEWTESESGKKWDGKGNFIAEIGKSMSAQLWTTLPMDLVTHSYDINCN